MEQSLRQTKMHIGSSACGAGTTQAIEGRWWLSRWLRTVCSRAGKRALAKRSRATKSATSKRMFMAVSAVPPALWLGLTSAKATKELHADKIKFTSLGIIAPGGSGKPLELPPTEAGVPAPSWPTLLPARLFVPPFAVRAAKAVPPPPLAIAASEDEPVPVPPVPVPDDMRPMPISRAAGGTS